MFERAQKREKFKIRLQDFLNNIKIVLGGCAEFGFNKLCLPMGNVLLSYQQHWVPGQIWKTNVNVKGKRNVSKDCIEKLITWLAVSRPSEERNFTSSLWNCICGAESSTFVSYFSGSKPEIQPVKDIKISMEDIYIVFIYAKKKKWQTPWSLSLVWTAGQNNVSLFCVRRMSGSSVMPSFFRNLPKHFTMRILQTRGDLLSCGVKSECIFYHFC